jgi:DnaJ-domain-containing protein 1
MPTETTNRRTSSEEGGRSENGQVPVIDHLLEAHSSRRSGVLRAEQGKVRRQLVFRNGEVVFAESNLPDEHLARVLVKTGQLQRADLTRIAEAMKKGATSEEAILTATSVPQTEIDAAARELAVSIAAILMACSAGDLRFYNHNAPLRRTIDLRLSSLTLILEAVRRAVSRNQVPARFSVLRGSVRAARNPGELRRRIPIDGAEGWAFSAIREPVPCSEIAARIPSSGESPEQLVKRLLLLGLVELELPRDPEAEANALQEAERLEDEITERIAQQVDSDNYKILGVQPDATDDQIRAAYHGLARTYHPDRYQARDEKLRALVNQLFTQITGAYSVLGDPVARMKHDEERKKRTASDEAGRDKRTRSESENQKMVESLFRAGSLSHSKGDHEKAAGLFKECVRIAPKVSKYHYALGLAQSEVPRLRKDAEKSFQEAIDLQPTNAACHLALARLYVKVNLPRRAEARVAELLTWDPGNREAQKLLEQLTGTAG